MTVAFKVFYPKINEIRLIAINYGSAYFMWDALRKQVRSTFELDELFEFHFLFIDGTSDSIHLKTREEFQTFMNLYNQKYPPLTIVANSTQEAESQTMNTNQVDQSSHSNDPKILESLETFIKHLELGINDMQEKIEKNTTSAIDIIVKTAAETAAHVHRSLITSSKNSTSVKPMHDVICNGCYRPIRGQRYLCETCDDFDLCSACKSRVNHDATHNFRYIAPIDNNPPSPKMTEQHSSDESSCSTQSRSSQNRFFCDNCDSEIVGVRHACTSCPDFDLCSKCFYSVKYEHPDRHLFVTHVEGSQKMPEKTINKKAKKPSNDKARIIQHSGVECDSCDTPIEGIRYKCGNCPNYDLCEQCEEKASLIHDENHVFVKLRRPIQSVVHMPLLPELRFLDTATAETSNTPEIVSKPEEISYTNIPQKPLPITPEPLINASFISDLNIPEGTVIVPKKTFIKMWKVKNTGTVDWPIGSQLLFNGGSILRPYPISRPDCFAVPVVAPNEETCITAELQAPDSPGVYTSYFCICTPNGERFGDSLLCSIKVDEDLEPEKKPSSMPRTTSNTSLSNSHIMVYPTIDSYSETHDDVSRQDELSQKDLNPVYPEYDACSDATSGNHSSVVESQTTYTYTDSQVSSPTSLNLDMHDDYTDNEWNPETEGIYSVDDYHVISPARSPSPVFPEELPKQETSSPCFDEDEFIVLDNKQDEVIVEVEEMTTDASSLTNSSITATPDAGHPYQSQLLQLHEMGFSSYDDLALSLLRFYEGEMERVVSKLLEYP